MNCLVDAPNFIGQTALHVMAQRDRFECVVALLSRGGADPNLIDKAGNGPLHEAASSGSLLVVQALIAFGADVNMLNGQGESPRHLVASVRRSGNVAGILYALHAVGAKRCSQKTAKCTDGCSPQGKDDGQQSPPVAEMIPRSRHLFDAMLKSVCQHSAHLNQPGKAVSSKGGRVLCLDGGGIRGLVLILLLEALEHYLGGPIVQHFDWIAGTSTGGILALAIASGRTVRECKAIYFRFKDHVFVGKRPYDETALEEFLRGEFGTKTMTDISAGPKYFSLPFFWFQLLTNIYCYRVLVLAVTADTIPADLHFVTTRHRKTC